ncbi:hypothetical protein CKM354_000075300 [Cercospora kikuchii]|uniref:BTB domain-containing protein n=1 Tax=Cercospora kikuchii TaxID=84275 RepID=A0A9P3CEL9_9PEZI|nr:uncharacterized protein CKM354_000075300 [Cercospora kikuchii]GIZ37303.1 hypothetical protein CKM354_000075300 [Cercospora kikuchii]
MADVPQASKKRRYASAIITLVVGQDEESVSFHVHEDLLREHSHFFDAALKNQWKEAQERKIALPEDKPDIVDMYVQWLYGGKIEAAVPETWHRAFPNAIMEAWTSSIDQPNANGSRYLTSVRTLSEIYQNTTSGSPVRQFLVHIWATYRRDHWMRSDDDVERLLECPEFLLDLARATVPKPANPYQSLHEMRKKWLYDV